MQVKDRPTIWKWIIENYYQVSNCGQIRSVDREVPYGGRDGRTRKLKGKVLKPQLGRGGYLQVCLGKGKGKTRRVHKLVAEAFLGPCPKGMEVLHASKNKQDNSAGNLSYGTHPENGLQKRKDGTHRGRPVIRGDGEHYINMTEAAEKNGCCVASICRACNGHRDFAAGHKWRYAEPEKHTSPGEPRPVLRSDGVIFPSLKAAAVATGCSPTGIGDACRGKLKTCGSYGWKFITEEKGV